MTVEEAIQLGLVHHQQGRLVEAQKVYRQILAHEPSNPDALHLLGVIAHQVGNHDSAIELIQRAIQARPDVHDFHVNLGEAYRSSKRHADAIQSFRRAIELQPERGDDHTKLGASLIDAGRADEALAILRRAIELDANDAFAHNNLGSALRVQGLISDAMAAFRRAIQLNPNLAQAHCNLAELHRQLGQPDEALTQLQRALQINPNLAEAHVALALVLLGSSDLDAAESACRRAIQLQPRLSSAHAALGNVIRDKGEIPQTIESYRTAIRLKPDDHRTHSSLLYTLLFDPRTDARTIAAENAAWNDRHARPLAVEIRPHDADRSPDRRLRIGYVSPDFRRTSMAYFLVPLLETHDREQFEIFCYSGTLRSDDITERIRSVAGVWRDVAAVPDSDVAELIRADRIDILIDLSMHMRDSRPLVFARKPAPVQAAWLAYPGSTGLDTIDYRITDSHLDPADRDATLYAERSLRLPDSWACYSPLRDTPPPNQPPSITNGVVTFGSFHTFVKINDDVLDLWGRMLNEMPTARLLMTAPPGSTRRRVSERFRQAGVDPDRIGFVPRQRHADYLTLYHQIDALLDPFPHTGFTTTCDAMWMGVPTVSLAGEMAHSRGGAGFLRTVGLHDFVARDVDHYIQICRDLPPLENLRKTLRERVRNSALMDAPRFARNIERAYRTIWRRHCRTQPPEEIFLK